MKLLLTGICSLLLSCFSFSQTDSSDPGAACPSPMQCFRDLRNPISNLQDDASILEKEYYYSKDPTHPETMPEFFHDVAYSGPDGCGGSNGCTEDGHILRYHVFYPSDQIFTYSETCKLPVLIYFHGGGFEDCNGTYLDDGIQKICKQFAKRGFIAVTVEYRTGVIGDPAPANYTVQQMLASWRAAQDARGAIRSIIRRENEGNEPYRIDTDLIFLVGNSAGAATALSAACYNLPSMFSNAFPSNISNSSILGPVNQNYYYGDATGPNAYTYSIKGILDMWGGVQIPKGVSTTTPEDFFFQSGNTIPPIIAFCGAKDKVFKPIKKPLFFPTDQSETYCLNSQSATYSVSSAQNPNGYILGSQSIYEMLKRKHVLTEFYLDCQMAHGLDCTPYNPPDCKTATFQSDFGTGYTTPDNVNLYIVQRAATFFQAVMNNKIYSDFATTKFVECVNKRHTCTNTADDNNTCPKDEFPSNQVCPPAQ